MQGSQSTHSPPRGWTLAFELSNPTSEPSDSPGDASSLALGRVTGAGSPAAAVELVAAERVAKSQPRSTEDDLFPAISRLLARAGITPTDLRGGRIAVSVGPGGYTGLRVACAAAKALAESMGAQCVSVPTALVALHARATALQGSGSSPSPRTVAVALASKSDSAWVFIEGWQDPTASRFITSANAAAFLAEHPIAALLADAHLPAPIREACTCAGIPILPPRLSAAACLHVSARLPAIDPALLVPIYAREPDAVTLWRERHG